MLRDRYNYDNRPGTDPRSYGKPFGKMVTEDSGAESLSHMELQDRLRSFLSKNFGVRVDKPGEEEKKKQRTKE